MQSFLFRSYTFSVRPKLIGLETFTFDKSRSPTFHKFENRKKKKKNATNTDFI